MSEAALTYQKEIESFSLSPEKLDEMLNSLLDEAKENTAVSITDTEEAAGI